MLDRPALGPNTISTQLTMVPSLPYSPLPTNRSTRLLRVEHCDPQENFGLHITLRITDLDHDSPEYDIAASLDPRTTLVNRAWNLL